MPLTSHMTKTEAAETIALHVRVAARKGAALSITLAEEIVSEYRGGHRGEFLQQAASLANPKTVLLLARKGL